MSIFCSLADSLPADSVDEASEIKQDQDGWFQRTRSLIRGPYHLASSSPTSTRPRAFRLVLSGNLRHTRACLTGRGTGLGSLRSCTWPRTSWPKASRTIPLIFLHVRFLSDCFGMSGDTGCRWSFPKASPDEGRKTSPSPQNTGISIWSFGGASGSSACSTISVLRAISPAWSFQPEAWTWFNPIWEAPVRRVMYGAQVEEGIPVPMRHGRPPRDANRMSIARMKRLICGREVHCISK